MVKHSIVEEHIVKILYTRMVTYNVKQFRFEKPAGYSFNPGQATEVSINTPELKNEKRPFTFTNLNSDAYLEFTIKLYPERKGVTNELGKLDPGSELIIRDVWGTIGFRGEGAFIAGGAGITPFIAIFRDLQTKGMLPGNRLIFANRRKKDIILEMELAGMLGDNFISILSDEKYDNYSSGYITRDFLKANIPAETKNYYLCGPPQMMDSMLLILTELGVSEESIIMEKM